MRIKIFPTLKSRHIMTSTNETLWEQLPLLAFKHYITQQLLVFSGTDCHKSPNFKYWQMTPASTKCCNVLGLLKFDRVISLPRELCLGSLAAWILMQWTVRLCSSTWWAFKVIIDVLLVWRMFRKVEETRVKIQKASFNWQSLMVHAFKSCRKDRIYKLNAHQCRHNLGTFFKLWVSELGAWQRENMADAIFFFIY